MAMTKALTHSTPRDAKILRGDVVVFEWVLAQSDTHLHDTCGNGVLWTNCSDVGVGRAKNPIIARQTASSSNPPLQIEVIITNFLNRISKKYEEFE